MKMGWILGFGLFVAGICVADGRLWQMRADADAGVEILCNRVPVVTTNYVFWGADWQYAGASFKVNTPKAGARRFTGAVSNLGLTINGMIISAQPNKLRYTWSIRAANALDGIIGGGIEFRLALNSPALGSATSGPVLLEGNKGWMWQVDSDEAITVEFEKPIDNVYFERGNKGQIRAMFLGSNVAAGLHNINMTVTLPEGAAVARTPAERYGPADTQNWYRDALRHDASPVDLSFLNHKPAGKFGFVRARGDKLVFENGDEIRFWGGNIAAYAIFVDKEQIAAQAKRIAQLGYNLMRIHHHDSTGWVGRTVIDKSRDDTQHLDADVMERLDYWIKCLRDEGVYVWLDLHVGRRFKQGDAIGEGFAEMLSGGDKAKGAEGKGFCYFNDRIEQLMKDFNQKYLNHVNRYTQLAYKDDPAIMGLLITNENDLTNHFGNLMLKDKNNPWHNRRFEAAVKSFAEAHGLDVAATGKTWLPGPAKLFLADWEYKWNVRMLAHLQQAGVKVPVATTQMWGGMGLCGLSPLTAGGIIDVHSYGKAEALSVNPRYAENYVAYLASGQVYGKPVAITEWNVPYPSVDRFTAPLYVASISSLQGWDAPMIYNYSQQGFARPSRPSTWSSFLDAGLTGLMPAAALLYRQEHVSEGRKSYCLVMDRRRLYFEGRHVKNTAALRTLVEQSRVSIGLPDTKELGWDMETTAAGGVEMVNDLDRDFIAAGQDYVRSDTGQLTRNWVKGYQIIDTPRTQAAHGWIGGENVRLADVEFNITTPKAAVAISSLDDKPIARSRRILITAIARVAASPGGRTPMLSEPVAGSFTIRAESGLKLVALGGDGEPLGTAAAPYKAGKYGINLPAQQGTHWWLLTE